MKIDKSYINFIEKIKKEFKQTQLKAVTRINSELIKFYFYVGKELYNKQENSSWGDKVLDLISKDLRKEGLKGFSVSNLKFIRRFYLKYREDKIGQQLVIQIPWGHNILIMDKAKNIKERHWYIKKNIENGWSRNVLRFQIDSLAYNRFNKEVINNFKNHLPPIQSDMAKDIFKDKYIFDFIDKEGKLLERQLENQLIDNIQKFILELGNGFSFMGNQFKLVLDQNEYFIDLLFFHRDLNCLIAIELKTGEFKPEYVGKMNFCLNLLKDNVKNDHENDPIGIILCQKKDKLIAKVSLNGINTPIAISEFTHLLEKELNNNIKRLKQEDM